MNQIKRLTVALLISASALQPTAALGHADYSLAPSAVSPFRYDCPFRMTTHYGEGRHVDWYGSAHLNAVHALDLVPTCGSTGTPLYAIYNGLRVYSVDHTNGTLDMRGWVGGQYHRVRFLHMHQIFVGPGQTVGTNTVVGTMGSRAFSTGPHLHLEVHVLGGGWFYSRRPVICGREIPHDHNASFRSC